MQVLIVVRTGLGLTHTDGWDLATILSKLGLKKCSSNALEIHRDEDVLTDASASLKALPDAGAASREMIVSEK